MKNQLWLNPLDLKEVLVKEANLHPPAMEASHHLQATEEDLHFPARGVVRHLQEVGAMHQEHHRTKAGGLLGLQQVLH